MNYFDLHADTLTEIKKTDESLYENTCDLDLKRIARFHGHYGQLFAIWKDRKLTAEGDPADEFLFLYRRALQLLNSENRRISICRNAEEMQAAWKLNKGAAFFSIEDLSLMGNLADRAFSYGIRFATLTWNYLNEYGCGAVSDQKRGLSEKGKAAVAEIDRQRMILDVSHLSDQGVEDVCCLTDRPFIASHSNLRAVCRHPRNLKTEHAKEIMRRKGLIGLNLFAPFVGTAPTLETFRKHLDMMLDLGGENAVSIGADFDGSDGRFPQGIIGVQSMQELRQYLADCGYTDSLLEKLFFQNVKEFMIRNL